MNDQAIHSYELPPNIPESISVAFMILVFVLLALILYGLKVILNRAGIERDKRRRIIMRTGFALILWCAFLKRISEMNFMHQWDAMPPRLAIVIVPPLIAAIVLVFSNRINLLLRLVPVQWLVWIQSFRVFMELILLWLFLENLIPVQMTFEGLNFDILAGLTAIAFGYGLNSGKFKPGAWILWWNLFSLALLVNIVVVAALSAPLPMRVFMNEPANTIVAYFPFVWLPGFVVPVAYTMHFLSIRKYFLERNTSL
jgi:hypothetical protein